MKISQVKIRGFRNFKDSEVNFSEKSLVIGSNDIGKTNLLYAMRLLLDRTISDADLTPLDSDFYVYEDTNEITITIKFEEAEDDCIRSKLGQQISDDGVIFIEYRGTRNPKNKKKDYSLWAGKSETELEEIECRFYLKVLNMQYISSNRDLHSFIRRERKNLLEDAMNLRDEVIIKKDNETYLGIEENLQSANKKISKLSYVKQATRDINKELVNLSLHHNMQDIAFDVCGPETSEFIDNLELVSQAKGKSMVIGGDGRNNQVFLALWAARNSVADNENLQVTIYCIEEPEAHLHPHQQRKLSNYLAKKLNGQVIITTHSPQISCEFQPDSIIHLCRTDTDTTASNNGCSKEIENSFIKFGYRLNIIPAEAFFSDLVFLVEGYSEVLFYKALAPYIGVDLDKLNISILMVDGVGFEPYVELFQALGIDFVLRTDNDIIKTPNTKKYRYAGVLRAIKIYENCCQSNITLDDLLLEKRKLSGFLTNNPPVKSKTLAKNIKGELENYDIFLSDIDLENDLKKSPLKDKIEKFFPTTDDADIIKQMQKQKATFMYQFLKRYEKSLGCLKASKLAKPLLRCKEMVESKYGITD